MKRYLYIPLLLLLAAHFTAQAQSGACATSGVYVSYNDYVNYPRSSGGDVDISATGYLEIGPEGIYDIYGSLNNMGILEVDSGAVLSLYGDMMHSGTLILHKGGAIHFFGKTWTNTAAAIVSDGLSSDTLTGGDLNFTGARPSVPATWLSSSPCLAIYSGGNASQNHDGGDVPMDVAWHINNANNVVLINTTARITGKLQWDIAGGDVVLNNNDLVFSQLAQQGGYGPDRFAITSGTGHVVKEQYSGNWIFPVGITDNDYTPAAINNTTVNTMHVLVQDYATSVPDEATTGVTADGMDRTWNIYADNAAGNSNITLQHNTVTNQPAFDNASNFVTRWSTSVPNYSGDLSIPYSTSAWQNNIAAAGSTGTLSSTGPVSGSNMRSRSYTDFATSATDAIAYFTKSSDPTHPLPVQLISFTATHEQCAVLLRFETGVETTIHKYYLQHSTDGVRFTTIAIIDPLGSNHTYEYKHEHPLKGNNIYRLSLVDVDGSYTVSPVASVKVDCEQTPSPVHIYPNPANDYVHVSGIVAPAQVRIMSLHGRIEQVVAAYSDNITLDISQLAHATYIIQVIWREQIRVSERLIKL